MVLRGIGKAFGLFLFSTSLLLLTIFNSLISFTEFENLKRIAIPTVKKFFEQQINFETAYAGVLLLCQVQDEIPLPFSIDSESISVKCNEIAGMERDEMFNFVILKYFEKIYYKQYDCPFLGCLIDREKGQERFLVLFSNYGNSFYKNAFNFSIIFLFVGATIAFVSIPTFQGRFRAFGTTMLFYSIPYIFFTLNLLPIPPEFETFAQPFLDPVQKILFYIFIAGIILTSIGYLPIWKVKKK